MAADSRITEKESEQKRDETLDLSKIDVDYLKRLIEDQLRNFKDTHESFLRQRQEWMLALRDLQYKYKEGYFENASDLHIPYTLIMAKAMHAKIFEVFSQKNFFSVEANNIAFREKEELVTDFMNWVLSKWVNRGRGKADAVDSWLADVIEEGSGILKLGFDRWTNTFIDVDLEVVEQEVTNLFVDGENLTDEPQTETVSKIKNVKKTLNHAAPRMGVVGMDDFFMPAGCLNVQEAPFVAHQVFLSDDDLKLRAQQGKFDEDLVVEALETRRRPQDANHDTRNEFLNLIHSRS